MRIRSSAAMRRATTAFTGASRNWGCTSSAARRRTTSSSPSGKIGEVNADGGHPAVFKDENPAAPPDARYKAIVRSNSPEGPARVQVGRRHALVADGRRAGDHGGRVRLAEPRVLGCGARRVSRLLAHFHRGRDRREELEARRLSRDSHRHVEGFPALGEPGRPDLHGLAVPSSSTPTR